MIIENNILLQELSWISNETRQCRCCSCIWGSQIYLTFLVAHSAGEVPICGRNTNLHNHPIIHKQWNKLFRFSVSSIIRKHLKANMAEKPFIHSHPTLFIVSISLPSLQEFIFYYKLQFLNRFGLNFKLF